MRGLMLLTSILLSGCYCNTAAKEASRDTSTATNQFDPQQAQQQANNAIQRGDLALWIEARRGVNVLGLADIDPQQIESHCGLKYLPHSGDVYRPEEAKLRQRYRQFGLQYNQWVIPHCLNKLK